MDRADLIEHLRAAMQPMHPDGTKTIIRLKSAALFRRFLQRMARLSQYDPRLRRVRPLPLIRGFSLPFDLQGEFGGHPHVLSVEKDEPWAAVHALADRPLGFPFSSGLAADRQRLPWGIRQIKAPSAWKRSTGTKVKIGVIDTGIDMTHPDLSYTTAGGINLVQRHLYPFDDNGHGTHISGTIAAASRRSGLIGVAPQAEVYAVKAFDRYGTAYVSDIVSGIQWCIHNRLDIINMSFGMKTYSKSLEDAVLAAYREKIVIVASSGNDGKPGFADYPAMFPHTVSVGATTKHKKIALFSNRGRKVDIYAPGESILSTWLGGTYNELSGTSMATSHVSGVIALMLAVKPGMTPQQIKTVLLQNGTVLSGKKKTSPKEVNALSTVRWTQSNP